MNVLHTARLTVAYRCCSILIDHRRILFFFYYYFILFIFDFYFYFMIKCIFFFRQHRNCTQPPKIAFFFQKTDTHTQQFECAMMTQHTRRRERTAVLFFCEANKKKPCTTVFTQLGFCSRGWGDRNQASTSWMTSWRRVCSFVCVCKCVSWKRY